MFGPRDRVCFLLVSYRPLAPRSHNFGQSWPLPDERHGQENEVKGSGQEAVGCQSQETERWLLRRRGIGRGLQELRRVQDPGEPAGKSLAWSDRRSQQRKAAQGRLRRHGRWQDGARAARYEAAVSRAEGAGHGGCGQGRPRGNEVGVLDAQRTRRAPMTGRRINRVGGRDPFLCSSVPPRVDAIIFNLNITNSLKTRDVREASG